MICSFIACGVRGPLPSRPSPDAVEVPSLRTKLVELKWPSPSPEEAMTPTNPLKRSSISSAATLENLHINTCITKYTSIKMVHTTLEFFLCKKCKEIPPQNACDPFSFCKSKWALLSKSHNLIQRQRRERAKIMDADKGYIGTDARPRPRGPAGKGERESERE
jgi:hypothetical protein